MIRTKEQQLESLIQRFMRQQGLEPPLNGYRAVQAWPDIVGPAIARYTGQIFIRSSILYVQIRSAALRENLTHQRTLLAQRVNSQVGAQVIQEIRFY
mgnify:FL=1